MKRLFDAANNLRKEFQATYKSMFGKNTHAAIEAEKAIIKLQEELVQKLSSVNSSSPFFSVSNEVNYIDQITTAVLNAANTGFENGQLLISAISGIIKYIPDMFNDVVWNVCRTVNDRRYYETSDNSAICIGIGANYLPYLLVLSTLGVVAATASRTEVVKIAAFSLINNLSTTMENLKSTIKTAIVSDSTQNCDSVSEETASSYLSELTTRFQYIAAKFQHKTAEIIEAQEPEVKSEATAPQSAVVDEIPTPTQSEPNYPSIFYGRYFS